MTDQEPIDSVCEETWLASVQGRCPVHGGDNCLIRPKVMLDNADRDIAQWKAKAEVLEEVLSDTREQVGDLMQEIEDSLVQRFAHNAERTRDERADADMVWESAAAAVQI